jgi:hypothetical protein
LAAGHSPEFVVPIDFILKNAGWDSIASGYDWIAAAHVIEHAPSMIDWLRSVGDTLKEGGILFLVVPDKRYTFDFFRPESTLGKIFEDHLIKKPDRESQRCLMGATTPEIYMPAISGKIPLKLNLTCDIPKAR